MRLSLLNVLLIALGAIALNNPLLGSEIRVWGPATSCPEVLTVPAGLTDVVQIAAGLGHIIALKNDGTVIAWGKNDEGQLNVPTGLTGIAQIRAGGNSNLAIRSDGTFVMWGFNGGQQTDIPTGLTNITDGAVSFYDTVAILPNGSLKQWGVFTTGTLPIVSTAQDAGIEAGLGLVRLSDKSIQMWHNVDHPTSRVTALAPPIGIQANRLFGPQYGTAMAITTSGQLQVWGSDALLISNAPTTAISSNMSNAANGLTHVLAIKSDGTMVTWSASIADTPQLAIPFGWANPSHISCGKQFNAALWATNAPNGSSPSNVQLTPAKTQPGMAAGVFVGNLTTADGDPGDKFVYSFVSGIGDENNALFQINGDTLSTLQITPNSNSILTTRIRTADSGGLAVEKIISIDNSIGAEPPEKTENNDGGGNCGLGSSSIILGILSVFFFSRKKQ